jgi:hypothetical protein
MFWKLFGLQKKFDALFDENWLLPGFVCSRGYGCITLSEAEPGWFESFS